jgi:gluconolactonase
MADSFLEGPCFDAQGHLYVTDIPHGRLFRITPDLQWHCVLESDGWPNGLALHADGSVWITDYRHGIQRFDPASGRLDTVLGHRNSESFKGVNDLVFDAQGRLYFTDQGQTGLHDPTGRVYRWQPDGRSTLVSTPRAPTARGQRGHARAGVPTRQSGARAAAGRWLSDGGAADLTGRSTVRR